jgi:hypothetical protein
VTRHAHCSACSTATTTATYPLLLSLVPLLLPLLLLLVVVVIAVRERAGEIRVRCAVFAHSQMCLLFTLIDTVEDEVEQAAVQRVAPLVVREAADALRLCTRARACVGACRVTALNVCMNRFDARLLTESACARVVAADGPRRESCC